MLLNRSRQLTFLYVNNINYFLNFDFLRILLRTLLFTLTFSYNFNIMLKSSIDTGFSEAKHTRFAVFFDFFKVFGIDQFCQNVGFWNVFACVLGVVFVRLCVASPKFKNESYFAESGLLIF